jgi:hypothetical protein
MIVVFERIREMICHFVILTRFSVDVSYAPLRVLPECATHHLKWSGRGGCPKCGGTEEVQDAMLMYNPMVLYVRDAKEDVTELRDGTCT